MLHTLPMLASLDGQALIKLLGRLHPAVVHFPIALLTVAAVLEFWQLLRRRADLAAGTPACVLLGAVSAVVAALFGWFLDESDGAGTLMALHKWIGIASAGVALAALLLLRGATNSPGVARLLRFSLFAVAALVGATGYLGGELVFGSNHLLKGIFVEQKIAAIPTDPPATSGQQDTKSATATVSFATDVAPILTDCCLRCHGGEKKKGKLSLKTRADALKGGESAQEKPCLVPGQPDKSLLYTMLVDPDVDARMPPPQEKKQLTKAQIETIRKWIAAGAEWPD
jgi:uncharacterized membrane protein